MLSPVRHVLRTAHKGGRVAVPFEQQARPASPLVSRVFVLTRRRSISLHRSAHALKHLRPMARSTSFTLSLIYFNMMFFDPFFFEKYSEECFALRVPRARDCTRGNRRAPRLPSHKAGGGIVSLHGSHMPTSYRHRRATSSELCGKSTTL